MNGREDTCRNTRNSGSYKPELERKRNQHATTQSMSQSDCGADIASTSTQHNMHVGSSAVVETKDPRIHMPAASVIDDVGANTCRVHPGTHACIAEVSLATHCLLRGTTMVSK